MRSRALSRSERAELAAWRAWPEQGFSIRAAPRCQKRSRGTSWCARLLNGSDYPLPGVFPIYSVDSMVELGYIENSAAPPFKDLREHNPLLFDFVLKRSLRAGGRRLPAGIFETRAFFDQFSQSNQSQGSRR